jgi:hypothetical protein
MNSVHNKNFIREDVTNLEIRQPSAAEARLNII